MPLSPENPKPTRESIHSWVGITAEDIPTGWIDDMVKRLFEIINRDMIRLEGVQIAESETETKKMTATEILEKVAQRERLATELRRNIERLSQLEIKRAAPRKQERRKKVAVSNGEARRALKRRIDEILAADAVGKDPGEPER